MIDAIPPERFDRQMAHLARAYRVLPLTEIVSRSRDGSLPPRAVAVTFDDGYADNFVHAFPILRSRGIPATVFLVSGYIGSDEVLWHDRVLRCFATTARPRWRAPWDAEERDLGPIPARRQAAFRMLGLLKAMNEAERLRAIGRLEEDLDVRQGVLSEALMLNWAQIRAMRDGGISFGSHTETHPILSRTAPERAWLELTRSKQAIEAGLGEGVTLFAYPNGKPEDYTGAVVEMVRRAGYHAALTTTFGVNEASDDPYLWRRGTPWEPDDDRFRLKLAYYRLRDPGPAPRPGGGA
jgi:peptidoglycan/xylan/chitin deacetylase (PgdA/CDA1 family)